MISLLSTLTEEEFVKAEAEARAKAKATRAEIFLARQNALLRIGKALESSGVSLDDLVLVFQIPMPKSDNGVGKV